MLQRTSVYQGRPLGRSSHEVVQEPVCEVAKLDAGPARLVTGQMMPETRSARLHAHSLLIWASSLVCCTDKSLPPAGACSMHPVCVSLQRQWRQLSPVRICSGCGAADLHKTTDCTADLTLTLHNAAALPSDGARADHTASSTADVAQLEPCRQAQVQAQEQAGHAGRQCQRPGHPGGPTARV